MMKTCIRTNITPSDIESIGRFHAEYYDKRYGFNHEFGEYVRTPLTEMIARCSPRERIWIVDCDEAVMGCIALVEVSKEEAQLRWYYVDENLRGKGLGNELMERLIQFAREEGYRKIFLWTVSLLMEARRMYERHGFQLAEEITRYQWGMNLTEQKFVINLG